MLIISQSACGINQGGGASSGSGSSSGASSQDTTVTSSGDGYTYGEDWLLNTYCYIKVFENGKEQEIKDAFKMARGLENKLSRTIDSSVVSEFNRAGTDTGISIFSEDNINFADVLTTALSFAEKTDGLFDPTIGAVSSLWDFTAEDPVLPEAEAINAALSHVGYEKVLMGIDGRVNKSEEGVMLDLGAIAKGYIADKTAEFLDAKGIKSAIISLGGNIVLVGTKPDKSAWKVGIEKPFSGNQDEVLENRESVGVVSWSGDGFYSVVTSGTYERCFEKDGKLYHHVLDPKTGYPKDTDLISVTITGPSSTYCDALSTACLLMGSEKVDAFMKEFNKSLSPDQAGSGIYEYVMIKADGSIIASDDAAFRLK